MKKSRISLRTLGVNVMLLLLTASTVGAKYRVVGSSCTFTSPSAAFAAGGFGKGKQTSIKKRKQSKQQRKKGFSDLLAETASPDDKKQPISKENEKVGASSSVDKWGLPIATIDDVFPTMGPDVELIPIDEHMRGTSLDEIQDCLKDHIDLQLEAWFDEKGVEKKLEPNEGRSPIQIRLLHRSPPVLAFDNFFTFQECSEIKAQTESDNVYKVNSATFTGAMSTRTSTSWFCRYSQVPSLLAKAHYLLNIPLEQMEEPQIVRYKTGQEFSWHYDEVPPPQLSNGGQRLATLLVYLNDVQSDGGGTVFRDLSQSSEKKSIPLTMRPKAGSALLFFPAFADGRPDDRTLHKGEVMRGAKDAEKWIIQMWIHQRSYQPTLPPGNSHEEARDAIESVGHKLGYMSNE